MGLAHGIRTNLCQEKGGEIKRRGGGGGEEGNECLTYLLVH